MWHAVLHVLEESLILLPFLFLCYVLVELVETWTSKKTTRSLKSKNYQVLLGASIGLIPQCGFSVVATDMYAKKKIRMGTLIAIFIATSDEAVPILLSNPDKIGSLLPLLALKFTFALIAGYIVLAVEKAIERKTIKINQGNQEEQKENNDNGHEDHEEDHHHEHTHENEENDDETVHIGCCGHEIENNEKPTTKTKLKRYLLHPLLHTLYIFAFILVVNLILGITLHAVGEEKLAEFMTQAKPLTPLLAVLVGLIPNCASSVVLTNMYIMGSLPFASMLAGLIANSGIAMTVLFKQNKNQKQNLTIIGVCTLTALIAGYSLLFIL